MKRFLQVKTKNIHTIMLSIVSFIFYYSFNLNLFAFFLPSLHFNSYFGFRFILSVRSVFLIIQMLKWRILFSVFGIFTPCKLISFDIFLFFPFIVIFVITFHSYYSSTELFFLNNIVVCVCISVCVHAIHSSRIVLLIDYNLFHGCICVEWVE